MCRRSEVYACLHRLLCCLEWWEITDWCKSRGYRVRRQPSTTLYQGSEIVLGYMFVLGGPGVNGRWCDHEDETYLDLPWEVVEELCRQVVGEVRM